MRRKGWSHGLRDLTRPLRDASIVPALEFFRLAVRLLPLSWALALGRGLGRLAWLTGGAHRRLAERQLRETGVAADAAQARQLARGVYQGVGTNMVEWLHSLGWGGEDFRRRFNIENLEEIAPLLESGRGIIFVSAHMGNWELTLRAFKALTGRTVASVMAEQRSPELTRWLLRQRERDESQIIPVRSAVTGILRHIRRGGLLALMGDQDSTRSQGIFVEFFGRPAYTPVGPAHLARLLGAPLVPTVLIREADRPQYHTFHVGRALWPNPDLPADEDIARLTQAYTRALEEWIRRWPAEWAWMHNRWRHQPGQKIRVRSAGGKKEKVMKVEDGVKSGD